MDVTIWPFSTRLLAEGQGGDITSVSGSPLPPEVLFVLDL